MVLQVAPVSPGADLGVLKLGLGCQLGTIYRVGEICAIGLRKASITAIQSYFK